MTKYIAVPFSFFAGSLAYHFGAWAETNPLPMLLCGVAAIALMICMIWER